jgi:prepilin-type N-terminal cleavage/methylation domain-containing protein
VFTPFLPRSKKQSIGSTKGSELFRKELPIIPGSMPGMSRRPGPGLSTVPGIKLFAGKILCPLGAETIACMRTTEMIGMLAERMEASAPLNRSLIRTFKLRGSAQNNGSETGWRQHLDIKELVMCRRKNFGMRHLSDHRGFSVIELAVVLGLIVILAALSAPVVGGYSPSYNAKKATRQIVSQMQLARIHSIKNRVTTVVVFYPNDFIPADQANSFLIFEDTDSDWIQDSGENVLVQRTYMPAKVNLISATFTSNGSGEATETSCCGFDSQGLAARKTGSVVYVTGDVQLKNSKDQTRTISINPFGKTKISMGS